MVTASDRYSLLVLMALFCFYVTPDIYMMITSADKLFRLFLVCIGEMHKLHKIELGTNLVPSKRSCKNNMTSFYYAC